MINKKFWKKKKVLITGHTGFKGGWLSLILSYLNCNVYGYALAPVGLNNFFNNVKIKKIFKKDIRKNIINYQELNKNIKKIKPEIIFHLAAQSSVIESFKNSKNTILTNVLGTANIIEAVKNNSSVKCLIIITTDKVYQNYKTRKHFDENSTLGGDDIYSGSKACCEILTNSYTKSFFQNNKLCRIVTVRAGNCFGGGDWTKDRIVKDALESFYKNKNLILRNPKSTRPWQHVLEPLFGYLILAEKLLSKNGSFFVGPWNFGPTSKQNMRVIDLVKIIKKKLNSRSNIIIKKKEKKFYNKKFKIFESKDLNINSSKAFNKLKWKPRLSIDSAVKLTVDWYKSFKNKENLLVASKKQIKNYLNS